MTKNQTEWQLRQLLFPSWSNSGRVYADARNECFTISLIKKYRQFIAQMLINRAKLLIEKRVCFFLSNMKQRKLSIFVWFFFSANLKQRKTIHTNEHNISCEFKEEKQILSGPFNVEKCFFVTLSLSISAISILWSATVYNRILLL